MPKRSFRAHKVRCPQCAQEKGGELLPSLDGCKWIVLSPTELRTWAPLNSYSRDDLLKAKYIIGALIESDGEGFSHDKIVECAHLLPSAQGNTLALAYYDLKSTIPQLYIPDRYLDLLEDEWQFELEYLRSEKNFRFPSYEQLLALMVPGDGSAMGVGTASS